MRVCNITCVNPFIFITQVCQNYKLWLCLIITFLVLICLKQFIRSRKIDFPELVALIYKSFKFGEII
ncbi:hypothetical protein JCM13304A_16610 [Desulfothermus okinawensis JCM 13304]